MSTICVIYTAEPAFPATEQQPAAIRYQIGELWVDAIGGEPTQDEINAVLNPVIPDVSGFINAIKTAMGGIVAANALSRTYPSFYPALQQGIWADVQALLIDAHTTGAMIDALYAQFKSLATQYNIPITLP